MNDLKSWKGKPVYPLDENAPLYKGDIIIIRFKWFLGGGGTYLKATQLSYIEKKLAGRSDFVVRSFSDQGEYLDAEIEVLVSPASESAGPGSGVTQAGLVVTAAVAVMAVAIAVVVTSIGFCLLKHEYYMLVKSGIMPPPSKSSYGEITGNIKVLVYVAGVLFVLYVFKNILGNSRARRNHGNSY